KVDDTNRVKVPHGTRSPDRHMAPWRKIGIDVLHVGQGVDFEVVTDQLHNSYLKALTTICLRNGFPLYVRSDNEFRSKEIADWSARNGGVRFSLSASQSLSVMRVRSNFVLRTTGLGDHSGTRLSRHTGIVPIVHANRDRDTLVALVPHVLWDTLTYFFRARGLLDGFLSMVRDVAAMLYFDQGGEKWLVSGSRSIRVRIPPPSSAVEALGPLLVEHFDVAGARASPFPQQAFWLSLLEHGLVLALVGRYSLEFILSSYVARYVCAGLLEEAELASVVSTLVSNAQHLVICGTVNAIFNTITGGDLGPILGGIVSTDLRSDIKDLVLHGNVVDPYELLWRGVAVGDHEPIGCQQLRPLDVPKDARIIVEAGQAGACVEYLARFAGMVPQYVEYSGDGFTRVPVRNVVVRSRRYTKLTVMPPIGRQHVLSDVHHPVFSMGWGWDLVDIAAVDGPAAVEDQPPSKKVRPMMTLGKASSKLVSPKPALHESARALQAYCAEAGGSASLSIRDLISRLLEVLNGEATASGSNLTKPIQVEDWDWVEKSKRAQAFGVMASLYHTVVPHSDNGVTTKLCQNRGDAFASMELLMQFNPALTWEEFCDMDMDVEVRESDFKSIVKSARAGLDVAGLCERIYQSEMVGVDSEAAALAAQLAAEEAERAEAVSELMEMARERQMDFGSSGLQAGESQAARSATLQPSAATVRKSRPKKSGITEAGNREQYSLRPRRH
ncbi:hypothetical protein FOL47_000736, partial [Perkinsus chesapeaki]